MTEVLLDFPVAKLVTQQKDESLIRHPAFAKVLDGMPSVVFLPCSLLTDASGLTGRVNHIKQAVSAGIDFLRESAILRI